MTVEPDLKKKRPRIAGGRFEGLVPPGPERETAMEIRRAAIVVGGEKR